MSLSIVAPYLVADTGNTFGHAASGSLLLAIPVAMLAGLVSFLSPCVLPLVPGYLSYVTGLSGADLAAEVEATDAPRRRWHVSGRVLAGSLLFVLGLAVGLVGGRAGDVVPMAVWLAVGFGVGYFVSRRAEQARQAWEVTRVLAAEQERQTARAIEDERARIARELHDVVAHGLSVIVVQAGAERRSLHGAKVDEASIDAALGSIERAGREALVDLRRLLGLLRRTDEPVALSPQPGLAQLDDLLSSVREAGLQVEVEVSGDRSALPPGLDLTAYRIVQEALTNVLKHANARCVRVCVAFERNHLDLVVSDDGSAGPRDGLAGTGSGHGLIGMRERVNVFGGTISAGADGGGWTVHARLPATAAGVG